jgi:hypothetical protein
MLVSATMITSKCDICKALAVSLISHMSLASSASSAGRFIFGVALITTLLGLAAICAMKGKWVFFVLGWFSGIFWIVGAWRIAKPNSFWARRRYGDVELTEAQLRFLAASNRSEAMSSYCTSSVNAPPRCEPERGPVEFRLIP